MVSKTRTTNYSVCPGCIHITEGICAISTQECNHTDFTGKQTGDQMTPFLKKNRKFNGGGK